MLVTMTVRRAHRTGYLELVTDFFVTLRARGLMLSAADLSLVESWKGEGIPAEVVCRGLQMGLESHGRARPGVPPPRHLAYYAGSVAEAALVAREKSLGRRS